MPVRWGEFNLGGGKFKQWLVDLRSSLWFVPALLVLTAVGLAVVLTRVDPLLSGSLARFVPSYLRASYDGSREVLSAIASSMITVAGVVFSITVVALALASQQFTPRVLRNFMRDRGTQVVLGVFVGVFSYCVVALLLMSEANPPRLVSLAAVVLVLVLVGLGCLIYFIHHIAQLIQVSQITAAIRAETLQTIDHLFPDKLSVSGRVEPVPSPGFAVADVVWESIPANDTGYVQRIEAEYLCRLASRHGVFFHFPHLVGDFVVQGATLVGVSPRVIDPSLVRAVNRLIVIGVHRTIEQDVEFGIRQLVDIALKALSPGINDVSTAITCVDQIGAVLCHLAPRNLQQGPWHSDDGKVRVAIEQPTFERLVRHGFAQISAAAGSEPAVLLRQLRTLHCLVGLTSHPARRQVLQAQVDNVLAHGPGCRDLPGALRQLEEQAAVIRQRFSAERARAA